MDSLDYGRRFIVDAFRPRTIQRDDRAQIDAYLVDLHAWLERDRAPRVTELVDDEDGFTAAVRGDEAHAVVHVFPGLGAMSLHVFSRRDLLLSDLTRQLARCFEVGRFESHLANATKALPQERVRFLSALAGDRAYARVRLDDRILAL